MSWVVRVMMNISSMYRFPFWDVELIDFGGGKPPPYKTRWVKFQSATFLLINRRLQDIIPCRPSLQ